MATGRGERRVPEFLDDHPRLWRRLRDLSEPRRLARAELLASFAAGLAIGVIGVNLWVTTWLAVLLQIMLHSGQAASIVATVTTMRAGPAMLLVLTVFGPGSLLSLLAIARFAQVTAARTRLSTPDGSVRPATLRMAVALTAGLLLGEPMSLLYANAGVWGYYDVSPAWNVADVLASAAVLAAVVLVVFQLAAESAAADLPTAQSPRRAANRATALLVIGAFPPYLTWNLVHGTGYVSRFFGSYVAPPLDTWFGTSVMFTTYYPLIYLVGLPATGLLFARPRSPSPPGGRPTAPRRAGCPLGCGPHSTSSARLGLSLH